MIRSQCHNPNDRMNLEGKIVNLTSHGAPRKHREMDRIMIIYQLWSMDRQSHQQGFTTRWSPLCMCFSPAASHSVGAATSLPQPILPSPSVEPPPPTSSTRGLPPPPPSGSGVPAPSSIRAGSDFCTLFSVPLAPVHVGK